MWYGDNITCKDWHHIWLNEGFATYGEAVIYENWYGKSGYDNYLSSEMNSAKNAVGSIWVQNISDVWEIFNGDRTYSKGSVVLHMLRGIVGDSTFFNIMRTYTSDPSVAYGVATTEDFKAIAEEVSGLDLNYFFQEWIYGENYPTYNIVWSKSSLGGNQWNLSIKIMQNVNSTPSFYTMPVKIKVSRAIGDTTITLFNNAQIQTFNISINGQPTAINFDSGNWILKTVGSIVTDVEVEDEIKLNSFSLEQNYPNPFNPSTKIKYSISVSNANLASSTLVQLKVYDILGNEIATLVNEEKPAGNYEVEFNPVLNLKNPVSGVYFYKLKAGSFVETKKMVLLK
jgi:hypothetical protein